MIVVGASAPALHFQQRGERMRRTNLLRKALFGGVLLSVLLGGVAATARAQVPVPMTSPGPRVNALIVGVNGTQRLQMSTKKNIKTITNSRPNVANVAAFADRRDIVLITGLEPGTARVVLTDDDGKEEAIDVLVQMDIEYLKTVLKQVVPTANIVPVPAANNTVILTGTLAKAEDVNIVLQTARSVVGPNVIDATRVAGVMQVQLDVCVA